MADARRGAIALRTRVFGIEVESSFEIPGLAGAEPSHTLPRTRLRLRTSAEIDDAWRPRKPERLVEETFRGKTPARTIDRDTELGFRLYARHFGLALISADGSEVGCAPPAVASWRWQRFLIGRVLPWAALLRGREIVHASAVRVHDRAVAMVAPSGMGKSSLALRMVLRGAGFVTDDVLAIDRGAVPPRAFPGAGIVAIRPAEKQALGRSELRRLGRVLGTSGKTYVSVAREDTALELGAVYFLRPRKSSTPAIEPGASPRLLLGSAFIASVTSPERLSGLLDLCATLSRDTPLFQLDVDPASGAEALAEQLLAHATETIAGAR